MQNLTIYLLREEYKNSKDAVAAGAAHHPVTSNLSILGDLYVKRGPQRPPKWAKLFAPYLDTQLLGFVQSTAGVLIVKANNRLFAITFGQGRFILNPESFEERFGLLVTLNSVPADRLRSIDKHTFDVVDQNSRVQANKLSTAFEFGIDIERDLVKGIVGYPTSIGLGKRLAGADSLCITTDISLANIKPLLRKLLVQFQSKLYQQQYSWIDHIHQLRAKGAKATELNQLLIQKLEQARASNGINDGCWISIPDVIDWERVAGFKFTKRAKDGIETDLHLPGFFRSLAADDVVTIELLKTRQAFAVDEDENEVHRWSVFRCLHCEVKDSDGSFVLSGGSWFAIDKNFVESINDFYTDLPRYPNKLLEYNHSGENAYNQDVAAKSGGRLALMDAVPIMVGGIYDKVEFCDLFSDSFELFHVKRYGGSNLLGHLFNQGLVSGELLRQHDAYPKLVNAKLPSTHHIPDSSDVPRDISNFSIVFAIVSQSLKPLHLPLFAMVSLKNAVNRLWNIGFDNRVYIAKIDSHPSTKIIKVAAKPAKKIKKKT
jgi:uncharacterized protein (TIGR04141 family)